MQTLLLVVPACFPCITLNLLILIDEALFAMEHYASIINLDYVYMFKMFQNRTQQGSTI